MKKVIATGLVLLSINAIGQKTTTDTTTFNDEINLHLMNYERKQLTGLILAGIATGLIALTPIVDEELKKPLFLCGGLAGAIGVSFRINALIDFKKATKPLKLK